MSRTSVGILRGGTSSEYDLSLKTGARMLQELPQDKYDARDIFIDKKGYWHLRGQPVDPMRALAQVDVVLNALHGGVGEDGTVQRIIRQAGLPYAGASAQAAALSLNKSRAGDELERAGVRVPNAVSFTPANNFTTGQMARYVFERFGPPYVIKPVNEGAGHGIRIAATLVELPDALADALEAFGSALVEEYIRGHDVSVGVIENFRGEELYALPPVHMIAPQNSRWIDADSHRSASIVHVVPSNFSHEEKQALIDVARAAHRALRMSHFSRVDIVLTPRTPYVLEVNANPGLYQGAPFPPALEAVGSSVREFLEHAIALARS